MEPEKFSENQIKDLIQEAAALEKTLPSTPLQQDEEPVRAPKKKTKIFLLCGLFAFILSALYLSYLYDEEPIVESKTTPLSKKIALMREAPVTFLHVESSLKELKQEREEILKPYAKRLASLLKANEQGAIFDFPRHFEKAMIAYRKMEVLQNQHISQQIDALYDETSPQTKEEEELFDLLVCDVKLEPYLSPMLHKTLAKTRNAPRIKLDMKQLHLSFWNK